MTISDAKTVTKMTKPLRPLPMTAEQWSILTKSMKLSPRQVQIVELILRGMQDKEIAAALGIEISTIQTYLHRVYHRMGVDDRMELAIKLLAISLELFGGDGCHRQP